MAEIQLNVAETVLKLVEPKSLVGTGVNYDTCTFTFGPEWQGYTKTVVFYNNKTIEPIAILLNENDKCIIPWESISDSGLLYIGVFGIKGIIEIPTNFVTIMIVQGAAGNNVPPPPSLSVYKQILDKVTEVKAVEESFNGAELERKTNEEERQQTYLDFKGDIQSGTGLKNELKASITTGNELDNKLKEDINLGNALDLSLKEDITQGNTLALKLKEDIATGNTLKTEIEKDITTANTSKENLEKVIETANTTTYATKGEIISTNAQLADKASVVTFFESKPIPAIDGSGEINADTIKYEDIIRLYDELIAKNTGYISKRLLGKDSSGTYNIYAYDFNASNPLDTIVIDANIHGGNTPNGGGDPKDCAIAIYYCMKKICEEWRNDKILCKLRREFNITVIPVANPWGYDNNSRYNSNGVDCNRNFSWNWRAENSAFGTAPFSEKESQYIRDNLINRQSIMKNKGCRIRCYIPFHNYGDNNIAPQFPFSVASTSPMYSVFKKVSFFLCAKYSYQFKEGIATNPQASSADNFAERILGIPTGTPEFSIFRNDGHFRDSLAITQQVEYYMNLIYFGAISNSKTKVSVFTPSSKFIVPKGNRATPNFVDNYTENVFEINNNEIVVPSGIEYIRIKGSFEFQYASPNEQKIAIVVTIQRNGEIGHIGYPVSELITTMGGTDSMFEYATLKIDSPIISVQAGDRFKINVGANNYSGVDLNLLPNKYNYIMFEEVDRYKY